MIYLLSKNPIKDSLRTNSKEQHHLLELIKSNKNITDVLLIVPPQAKKNANALESHIKEISDARTRNFFPTSCIGECKSIPASLYDITR